jgi:NADH-quinone oxidoreductase subunit A
MYILVTSESLSTANLRAFIAAAHAMAYADFITFVLPVIALCGLLSSVAYLLALSSIQDTEKRSEYECGFVPFDSATRLPFDVHFYLVGILFLIFDVEVALLIPWVIAQNSIGLYAYLIGKQFVIILTVAFVYEWSRDALIWPSRYSDVRTTKTTALIAKWIFCISGLTQLSLFELGLCLSVIAVTPFVLKDKSTDEQELPKDGLPAGPELPKDKSTDEQELPKDGPVFGPELPKDGLPAGPELPKDGPVFGPQEKPKKIRPKRRRKRKRPKRPKCMLSMRQRTRFFYFAARQLYFILSTIRTYLPIAWTAAILLAIGDMLFDLVFLGYEEVWAGAKELYKLMGRAFTRYYPPIEKHPIISGVLRFLLLFPCGVWHYLRMEGFFAETFHPKLGFCYYRNYSTIPAASLCFVFWLYHIEQGRVYAWQYSKKAYKAIKVGYDAVMEAEDLRSLPYRSRHPDKGYKDIFLYGAFATAVITALPDSWREPIFIIIPAAWNRLLHTFNRYYIFEPHSRVYYKQNILPAVVCSVAVMSFASVYTKIFRRYKYGCSAEWLRLLLSLVILSLSTFLYAVYKDWELRYYAHWSITSWLVLIWHALAYKFIWWLALFFLFARGLKFFILRHAREILSWRFRLTKRHKRFKVEAVRTANVTVDLAGIAAQQAANLAKCAAAPTFDKTVLLKHPSAMPDVFTEDLGEPPNKSEELPTKGVELPAQNTKNLLTRNT